MTDLRACVLGDSYVLGVGDSTGLGWPGRVWADARGQGFDLTLYNLGIRGETGAEILARAAAETTPRLASGHRRALVVAFGGNDLRKARPTTESLSGLYGLIDLARAQSAAPFVISPPLHPPESDESLAVLAAAMQAACASVGVPYLDLRAAAFNWARWWDQARAGDGAHPAADSYAAYAAAFSAWAPWRAWLAGAA